jgi:hypothetical protein
VGWPVGVQVVKDHESCPGAGGSGQHPLLEGRELLCPAGVAAGVETEGDAVGSCADGGGEGGVGRVTRDDLCVTYGAAVSVDRDDVVALSDELADQVPADLAGTKDDVAAHARFRWVEPC